MKTKKQTYIKYDAHNAIMQSYAYVTIADPTLGVPNWDWKSSSRGLKNRLCNIKISPFKSFRIKCKK